MDTILNFLKSSTWFSTIANKLIRHAATAAGAAVLALAVSHGVNNETATDLQNEIAGLVVTLGGIAWSLWDAKSVGNKITATAVTAAATGSTSIPPAVLQAVEAAITKADKEAPTSMAGVLDKLGKGEG